MANHPSAEKRNRQRLVRTDRNRAVRSALRTTLKKAHLALDAGSKETAAALTHAAETALAQAASRGVIHRNNAARRTSRLYKALAKLA